MERRKALATAASVSAVALAATIAIGANVGLFGLTSSDNGPGSFKLVDAKTSEPIVRTEIVDVPITTSGSDSSTNGSPSTTRSVSSDGTQATPAVGPAPRVDDDESEDDHSAEDDHGAEDDSHESAPEHDEDD